MGEEPMNEHINVKVPLIIVERLLQHYGCKTLKQAVARCLLEKIAEEWGEPLAKSLKRRYYNSFGIVLPERKEQLEIPTRHQKLRIKIVS